MRSLFVMTLVASVAHADAVWLTSMGPNKLQVVKEIRASTGLGLKESKELAERAPTLVKAGVAKADASALVAKLKAVGANAETREEGAPAVAPTPAVTPTPAPGPVTGAGSVWLLVTGANKLLVIKEVRLVTGLGLKESKDLVERAPTVVKERLSAADAEALVAKLKAAGATAEIRPAP